MSTKSTKAATPPSEPRLGRTLTLSTRPYLMRKQGGKQGKLFSAFIDQLGFGIYMYINIFTVSQMRAAFNSLSCKLLDEMMSMCVCLRKGWEARWFCCTSFTTLLCGTFLQGNSNPATGPKTSAQSTVIDAMHTFSNICIFLFFLKEDALEMERIQMRQGPHI